jgi:hypothetical protein
VKPPDADRNGRRGDDRHEDCDRPAPARFS